MLFNSYPFIFVFLPVVLVGYFAANRLGRTAPVVWLLDKTSLTVFALLGLKREREDHVTAEELHLVVAEASSAGVIEESERAIISGVVRLADRPVREVMTPRPEVDWIDADNQPQTQGAEDSAYMGQNPPYLAANQYITKQTWAKGIDEEGRPIPTEITDQVRQGKEVDVWPGAMGGKNWSPVSFDPQTGLVYANTLNFGMHYKPVNAEFRAGLTYWGADITWIWPDGARGGLKAIDPLTGKAKWEAMTPAERQAKIEELKKRTGQLEMMNGEGHPGLPKGHPGAASPAGNAPTGTPAAQ